MDFDFAELPEKDRYRLLCSFVGPRTIALVTTVDEQGWKNAAPMSFSNVFSHDPPLLILGMQTRPDGSSKVRSRISGSRANSSFTWWTWRSPRR